MSMILWPAPAKLNLFLHVTGRRPDGYHNLQTVFQFIDYGDELRFSIRADGAINLTSVLPDVEPQNNLIFRAAQLLQTSAGITAGADIELCKRLPVGGGLGGGSSDAATTLVALNQLWNIGLPVDALAALGLRLGADVPVFVRGQAAWAEGVGERMLPVELAESWYLVIVPPCQVSTKAIFSAADLTRDHKPITISDFVAGRAGNDCEAPVCARYPDVARALVWLAQFARARMTGTGACVFAAFGSETEARLIEQRFVKDWTAPWRSFVARGLNRSPLQTCLTRTAGT